MVPTDSIFNLADYLARKKELVEENVKRVLEEEGNHPLTSAYAYAMTGGKRIRPILLMAAAEACGIEAEKVVYAALCIEFIHNFSLVHDDLPCMDNDVERRGMPTVHVKFGEGNALLAGDGLLIFAFELLSRNASVKGIDPEAVGRTLGIISGAAGHRGMTGGQVLDTQYQDSPTIEKEILEQIHRSKTGALITASLVSGGILGGGTKEEIKALETYGRNVGLTFQIIDDIKDMDEDSKTISYPAVFGLEESKAMAKKATNDAIEVLEIFGEKARPLREFALYLLNRKK